MNNREIRMRCIEAISHSGIREPARILADAAKLEEWVLKAEEPEGQAKPKRGRPPQTAG